MKVFSILNKHITSLIYNLIYIFCYYLLNYAKITSYYPQIVIIIKKIYLYDQFLLAGNNWQITIYFYSISVDLSMEI